MSTIIVNRHGDKLTGSVNGVPYSVSYNPEKHAAMKEIRDKAANASSIEALRFYCNEFMGLTREDYADYVETKSPYIKVNRSTNRFHVQYEGVVSDRPMPEQLAQKIIRAVEAHAEILPIVKFWVRYLHNPNYTFEKAQRVVSYISTTYTNEQQVSNLVSLNGVTREIAEAFSTTSQVAVTQEGLMVGYKASKEITNVGDKYLLNNLPDHLKRIEPPPMKMDDTTGLMVYDSTPYDEVRIFEPANQRQNGDAFYCGDYLGHIIKVGKVHFLPRWDQVNCNDRATGVKGLHCGGLKYIIGYQYEGTVTHNILIDPMHFGAVVGLGSGDDGAMRVKQYFVLNAFNGVNKSLYHSSTYAKLTDHEYHKMIKSAAEGKVLDW